MTTKTGTLTRHLRNGVDAPIPNVTAARARSWVLLCLADNGVVDGPGAAAFASSVTSRPGQRVEHPSGYAFTYA